MARLSFHPYSEAIMKKFALSFLALLVFSGSAFAADQRIAIGASNSQSAHYAYFSTIAKIVNDAKVGLSLSLVETGAGVDNLKRMQRGQLDIGLSTSNTMWHAYHGTGAFKDQPIKSKMLWIYNLAAQNAIVRKDSGVTTLKDLEGKRMGPGQRGSGTEQATESVFKALNIKPEWVRGSNAEISANVKDNRTIGLIQSTVGMGFNPLTMDIATFTQLYCLGLTPEEETVVKNQLPELTVVEMPGGKLEGREGYRIWAFLIGVSASPTLSDEAAYLLTKYACENIEPQAAAFNGLVSKNLAEATLKYCNTPLHPGAIKYYEEKGYTVPKHLK